MCVSEFRVYITIQCVYKCGHIIMGMCVSVVYEIMSLSMYMRVCVLYICICVLMWERERERERNSQSVGYEWWGSWTHFPQSCCPGSSKALIFTLPSDPPLYVSRGSAR